VWDDYLASRSGGFDILMYDLVTETEIPIVADDKQQNRPRISGGRIAWEDLRNGGVDIYMYDVATQEEAPITTAFGLQTNPHISGDLVVWQDSRGNWDIYAYDLSTQTERAVVTEPHQQFLGNGDPISGNRIVYFDDRNGNNDVFMYDLATETETQITSDPADQENPSIFGNYIVWTDNRNGNWDIFQVEISTASFEALDVLIDEFVASGSISNSGIAEALRALSDQAAAAQELGNLHAAVSTLNALVRLVDGQTGRHITLEAALELTDVANAIIDSL
jgi:beta propeller repeat protein